MPNVRVPTTVARSRSCSAPVTISDADAEPSLTSTTTGSFGVDRVARRLEGARRRASGPRVETIVPVGDEDRGDEDRLVEQAAAVVAQVEHDAGGALLEQLADRRADLAVRAAR